MYNHINIGLSLFQKICDLKIEQIAVQIPNREKAIRQLLQPQQESKEVKELTEATKQLEISDKVENVEKSEKVEPAVTVTP